MKKILMLLTGLLTAIILLSACSTPKEELTIVGVPWDYEATEYIVPSVSNMMNCITYKNSAFHVIAGNEMYRDEPLYYTASCFDDIGKLSQEYNYTLNSADGTARAITVDDAGRISILETTDDCVQIRTQNEPGSACNVIIPLSMDHIGGTYDMLSGSRGEYILMLASGIYILERNGKVINSINNVDRPDSIVLNNEVYVLKNTADARTNEAIVFRANFESGKLEHIYSLPFTCKGLIDGKAAGFDLIAYSVSGIYGINLNDQKKIYNLIEWEKHGLPPYWTDNLMIAEDGDMYAITVRSGEIEDSTISSLVHFRKIDEKNCKTEIQLGAFSPQLELVNQVNRFNLSDDEFYIKIKEYQWENLSKFYTEVMSGKGPDILDLSGLPSESFFSSGAIEDLYPYFERDTELDISQFNHSYINAYEYEGSLYGISSSFFLATVVTSAQVWDGAEHWRLSDLILAENQNSIKCGIPNLSRYDILELLLTYNVNRFVDFENCTAQFDSSAFKELLEYCSKYPEQMTAITVTSEDTAVLEGSCVALPASISDFYITQYYRELFGGEISFVGYPSDTTSGSTFLTGLNLSILTSSEHKDGAWKFIRSFLTKEYQCKHLGIAAFPTRIDAFEELVREVKQNRENLGGISGESIRVRYQPVSEADIQLLEDLIESTDSVRYNGPIIKVVLEEVPYYFNGERELSDVIKLIQSRVEIYLSEQFS